MRTHVFVKERLNMYVDTKRIRLLAERCNINKLKQLGVAFCLSLQQEFPCALGLTRRSLDLILVA